jgi:hypothetical protein
MSETLRNGIPLAVQTGPYAFEGAPPLRVGDEARIFTLRGSFHVILLRGTGRKRWLVNAATLRRYLREDARQKFAALCS